MLKAKLVVVGGDAKSSEVTLKQLPCVIGRAKEATLTLPHPLVSRRHTELFERDGKLWVRDLGSLNGTFLNNERLKSAQPIEPNQLLTLGNVTFRAVYEPEPQTASGKAAVPTLGDTVRNEAVKQDTSEERPDFAPVADSAPAGTAADAGSGFDLLTTTPVDAIPDEEPAAASGQPAAPAESARDTQSADAPTDSSGIDFDQLDDGTSVSDILNFDSSIDSAIPDTGKSLLNDEVFGEPKKPEDSGAESAADSGSGGVSSISLEPEDISAAEKSISLSSLDGLPTGGPSASFTSPPIVDDDLKSAESIKEAVKIDPGDGEAINREDQDEGKLDSFINKLPR